MKERQKLDWGKWLRYLNLGKAIFRRFGVRDHQALGWIAEGRIEQILPKLPDASQVEIAKGSILDNDLKTAR